MHAGQTSTRLGRFWHRLLFVFCLIWLPWVAARLIDVDSLGWWAVAPQTASLYAFALSVVATVIAIALRRWRAAAAGLLGLIILGSLLSERVTSNHQPTVARGVPFNVLVANLNQGRADPRALVDLIRRENIDAATLIEVTPQERDALSAAGLGALLPHSELVALPDSGGLGTFTRRPSRWDHDFVPPNRPWRPAIIDLPNGSTLRFEGVHGTPPRPKTEARFARQTQFEQIPGPIYKSAPVIIAGDFNATLDNHPIRALLKRGYRDAASEKGLGLVPTWQGFHGLARLTIDHVLVPDDVAVQSVSIVPIAGSDHHAVIARLIVQTR